MSWPVQLRDHHGVVHGARLDADTTVCTATSPTGAPYGCRLEDEVGEVFLYGEVVTGPRCPVCYPPRGDE